MHTKPTTQTQTNEPMHTTKSKRATKKPTSTTESTPSMSTTSASAHETATVTTSIESESAPMKTVDHVTSAAIVPAPAAAAAAPVPTTAAAPPATSPLPFVKAPPPITLPAVPPHTVAVQTADRRGQLPRKQELALIPEAQTELQRFADYPAVFGKTAPARAVMEQTLSSAYQWSMLRQGLTAWATYALAQEIASWVATRNLVDRLSPAFGLAVKTDSAIGESYPSLGQLFGVRASIAKRAVANRMANTKAEKEGKPAFKGAAGKRRLRAAEKAAFQAQQAAAEAHAAPPAADPAAPPAPPAPTPAQIPVNVGTIAHA